MVARFPDGVFASVSRSFSSGDSRLRSVYCIASGRLVRCVRRGCVQRFSGLLRDDGLRISLDRLRLCWSSRPSLFWNDLGQLVRGSFGVNLSCKGLTAGKVVAGCSVLWARVARCGYNPASKSNGIGNCLHVRTDRQASAEGGFLALGRKLDDAVL